MAKVRENIVIQGLSGSLGDQLVIKIDKGGRTIVSVKPAFDEGREFTPAQQAQQQAFREATAYAKEAHEDEVYTTKAEGTAKSAYNVAVADWFHAPEILEIDLGGWDGQAGQPIRMRVQDDVQVERVTVVITDAADAVLEQGEASEEGALWWEYTTTAAASGSPKVIVSAEDLPGHITQVTQQK